MTKRQDPKAKKTDLSTKGKSNPGISETPNRSGIQGSGLQNAGSQQTTKFKKGQSGNPAGREPGSKNLRTLEWEAFGKAIIEGNLGWMQDHLEDLKADNPEAAFDRLVDLMEYFKPKLSRQELKAPPGSQVTYTLKFK